MIVIKTDPATVVQPIELSFRQRVEAFLKFTSTQVLAIIAAIPIIWDFVPPNVKEEYLGSLPPWARLSIYVVIAVFVFYKSRLRTETIAVAPTKEQQATADTMPADPSAPIEK